MPKISPNQFIRIRTLKIARSFEIQPTIGFQRFLWLRWLCFTALVTILIINSDIYYIPKFPENESVFYINKIGHNSTYCLNFFSKYDSEGLGVSHIRKYQWPNIEKYCQLIHRLAAKLWHLTWLPLTAKGYFYQHVQKRHVCLKWLPFQLFLLQFLIYHADTVDSLT